VTNIRIRTNLVTTDGCKTLKLDTHRNELAGMKWLTFNTSGFLLQKEIGLIC